MKLESLNLWTSFRELLETEIKESREEGRAFDPEPAMRAAAEYARKKACGGTGSGSEGFEKDEEEARSLLRMMECAPLREDFPYEEPEDPEEIRAVCIAGAGAVRGEIAGSALSLTEGFIREHLAGAVAGRVAACTIGMPVEGWMRDRITGYLRAIGAYPLKWYIPSDADASARERFEVKDGDSFLPYGREMVCWINNLTLDKASPAIREEAEKYRSRGREAKYFFPVDDDINYMALALKTVEKAGRNFTPGDYAAVLAMSVPPFHECTAERVAVRNLLNGLVPPETASCCNPYREWIGAQIRTDFYGYINPGNPAGAALMALNDASVTHTKNGVYAAMYVAALISLAYLPELEMKDRVRIALELLPQRSRFVLEIRRLVALAEAGADYEALENDVHSRFDEADNHDWCLAVPNALLVTAAVLTKESFGEAAAAAAMSGFDTDCNAATVGSVMGMAAGLSGIPGKWLEDFLPVMHTSVYGYESIPFEEFVERAMALMH